MSFPQLPKVSIDMELKDLANLVAILIKEVTWLMNGHVDDKNIRANSITANLIKAKAITADKMDVNQLSAISANLGLITAGILQAVEIYGAHISGGTINVDTDIHVGNNIFLGDQNSGASKKINISNSTGAKASMSYLSGDVSFNVDGFFSVNTGSSMGMVVNGSRMAKINETGRTLSYDPFSKNLSLHAANGMVLSTVNLS